MTRILCMVITLTLTFITPVFADVTLHNLFTDNMVLQRNTNAAIWGWADPEEEITITGSWGETVTVTANADGKWCIKIPTPEAGGPHTVTAKGKNTITLKNILSGEVWLCSGQSNMALPVKNANNSEQETAAAQYNMIRHYRVKSNANITPQNNCEGNWKVCSPNTVSNFSATAYYFGRKLYKDLNIPIGLLVSCWGGTPIEAWTSKATLKKDPAIKEEIAKKELWAANYNEDKAMAKYKEDLRKYNETVKELKKQGKKLRIKGKKIKKPRQPVHPEKNPHFHGILYSGMIVPLTPFEFKGAIWYQGESNSKTMQKAFDYRKRLADMVSDWRVLWQKEANQFPFYAVQLPNFKKPQTEPVHNDETWPVIRDSFIHMTKTIPNTSMAITIDAGEEKNIHPGNKQAVGLRLGHLALNKTYGKDIVASGPVYRRHKIIDNRVIIEFDYTGSGLIAKDGKLEKFAIAGEDKKFVWANAQIKKNTVIVSSPDIQDPVAVRYAWADNPEGCNLYNREELPASPFRTDDWPLF